ncbi:arginine/serine-rich protein 1 [Denticeps clupeoides]|uniref:Arginine/serine-rich protein 1 n=1 Tax=Denticeps clupeoides TaxID=299321 RepID=A0AAY4DJ42_9TELE|nr:arginine/serine-rich protein 1 [Denticeps clupeoides]XP_028849903.1 arginine/serine-rich protein 1 [Denticeps clupeoides]
MKTDDNQVKTAHLTEVMQMIFDQESPSSSSHCRSRSSSRSSYSSSDSCLSRDLKRSVKRRDQNCSSSSDSSTPSSHSRTRSRSHPRCHRGSHRSQSRCNRHSPPRSYRACSRSYTSSTRQYYRRRNDSPPRRYHVRSPSCSTSPSPDHYCYRRGHPSHSGSPSYRSKSRSPQRSVYLSLEEKRKLLKVAEANVVKILGIDRLELPENLKNPYLPEEKKAMATKPVHREKTPSLSEWVRPEPVSVPQMSLSKVSDGKIDDSQNSRTSPTRKPITFSLNNVVAKPTSSTSQNTAESKVTPRVDIVGSRKPYGQWMPVKRRVPPRFSSSSSTRC